MRNKKQVLSRAGFALLLWLFVSAPIAFFVVLGVACWELNK